jgi:hypothetical protein
MLSAHHRASLSASHLLLTALSVSVVTNLASAGVSCSCPADLDLSGTVDASDLAILLGGWGTGATESDLNGNGVVEAADLSILLGAWGTCGAPANDTCSGATVLSSLYSQDVPFCTLNAATDGPANPLCDSFGSDQITNDVWFKVAAPTDGLMRVSTCGANFDTRLAVYRSGIFGATCPTGSVTSAVMLACNDDTSSCVETLNSEVLVAVGADATYTIRTGGYSGAVGSGSLSIDFIQQGDFIEDAIPIYLTDQGRGATEIRVGTTIYATASANPDPNSCGGVNDTKDLWFLVDMACVQGGAQAVEFSVSTCMPGTNMDTTLTVYSGSIGNLTEVACNDDFVMRSCQLGGLNWKSFISIVPQSPFAIYWVRLAGYNGAVGDYEVKFDLVCTN